MTLTLLQLNINSDNYWNKLIPFLTTHDFDILQLQEITGDGTICGIINSRHDIYNELKKVLKERYNSEFVESQRFTSSTTSYMGVATFYKKAFSLKAKQATVLYSYDGLFPSDATSFEELGRKALHLTLEKEGKIFSCINAHLAWAKTSIEEPHQTKQSKILLDYLQKLSPPFILSGDFNLDSNQPTIQEFNKLAHNLTQEYHIANTLNPRTHRAKELFPKGVTVDYIFVSNELKVKNFAVIEEDISDHFGLTVEIEI